MSSQSSYAKDNPSAMEMRALSSYMRAISCAAYPPPDAAAAPLAAPTAAATAAPDMASVDTMDSSDTYASCNTHPFLSQELIDVEWLDFSASSPAMLGDGDVDATGGNANGGDVNNLYINPLASDDVLGKRGRGCQCQQQQQEVAADGSGGGGGGGSESPQKSKGNIRTAVRSASGDAALETALRELAEEREGRGSRGSLVESPASRRRRTRFQQDQKPRPRFEEEQQWQGSQDSLARREKKGRRHSFIPSRSLASATRLLNQHLFGLSLGAGKKGKSGSKSSLSGEESLDSRRSVTGSPPEKKKSILKKSESGHKSDPETEKLIPDVSASVTPTPTPPTASRSEHGPPPPTPGPIRQQLPPPPHHQLRGIGPRMMGSKPQALPIKFVGVDDGDSHRRRVLKSPLPRADLLADLLSDYQEKAARDESAVENRAKERLERASSKSSESSQGTLTPTSRDTVVAVGSAASAPRCCNPNCQFNQVAQSTSRGAVCMCGQQMETLRSGGRPLMTPNTATHPLLLPPPPASSSSSSPSGNRNRNRLDYEDFLFADYSPSEETRLLEKEPNMSSGTASRHLPTS